eukprot:scaffold276535_cov12-Tisochrysis_lutea.AAC.1
MAGHFTGSTSWGFRGAGVGVQKSPLGPRFWQGKWLVNMATNAPLRVAALFPGQIKHKNKL